MSPETQVIVVAAFGHQARALSAEEVTALKALDWKVESDEIIDAVADSSDNDDVCNIIDLHARSPEDRALMLFGRKVTGQRLENFKLIWDVAEPQAAKPDPKPEKAAEKAEAAQGDKAEEAVDDPNQGIDSELLGLGGGTEEETDDDESQPGRKPGTEKIAQGIPLAPEVAEAKNKLVVAQTEFEIGELGRKAKDAAAAHEAKHHKPEPKGPSPGEKALDAEEERRKAKRAEEKPAAPAAAVAEAPATATIVAPPVAAAVPVAARTNWWQWIAIGVTVLFVGYFAYQMGGGGNVSVATPDPAAKAAVIVAKAKEKKEMYDAMVAECKKQGHYPDDKPDEFCQGLLAPYVP